MRTNNNRDIRTEVVVRALEKALAGPHVPSKAALTDAAALVLEWLDEDTYARHLDYLQACKPAAYGRHEEVF